MPRIEREVDVLRQHALVHETGQVQRADGDTEQLAAVGDHWPAAGAWLDRRRELEQPGGSLQAGTRADVPARHVGCAGQQPGERVADVGDGLAQHQLLARAQGQRGVRAAPAVHHRKVQQVAADARGDREGLVALLRLDRDAIADHVRGGQQLAGLVHEEARAGLLRVLPAHKRLGREGRNLAGRGEALGRRLDLAQHVHQHCHHRLVEQRLHGAGVADAACRLGERRLADQGTLRIQRAVVHRQAQLAALVLPLRVHGQEQAIGALQAGGRGDGVREQLRHDLAAGVLQRLAGIHPSTEQRHVEAELARPLREVHRQRRVVGHGDAGRQLDVTRQQRGGFGGSGVSRRRQ